MLLYIMLTFVILLLVLSTFLKKPKVKGYLGEQAVRRQLGKLDARAYIAFQDLLLPKETGGTSQIDHVVVSRYGVFVIETKNYQGLIVGNEQQKDWKQVFNRNKFPFYNPIWQNNSHIKALKGQLSGWKGIRYFSIIAFANDAKLRVTAGEHVSVMHIREVVKYIRQQREAVLSDADVQAICDHIRYVNIHGKIARKQHVAHVQETIQEHATLIEQGVCPRCGRELVQRKGKHGAFQGCSGYPKCTFTRK